MIRITNATTKTSNPSEPDMVPPSTGRRRGVALPTRRDAVIRLPPPLTRPARLHPPLQLALDDVRDHAHAVRAVVEARQIGELLAAMLHEDVAVLHVELLQRLETVGREAGRHDGQALHPALGK